MKRLLVLAAVAFGAVALYAMTAPAGQRAVTPGQITALNKKVSALQKQVKTLNGAVADLQTCVFAKNHVIGMTLYSGFQYMRSDGSVISTTAIATTDQGETPQYYVLTTTAACAKAIGVGRALPRVVNR
jgi:hypothetical protein